MSYQRNLARIDVELGPVGIPMAYFLSVLEQTSRHRAAGQPAARSRRTG